MQLQSSLGHVVSETVAREVFPLQTEMFPLLIFLARDSLKFQLVCDRWPFVNVVSLAPHHRLLARCRYLLTPLGLPPLRCLDSCLIYRRATLSVHVDLVLLEYLTALLTTQQLALDRHFFPSGLRPAPE